jgi:ankyrin repeat protein
MRISLLLILGLVTTSCLSMGFNEKEESYYRWRVNLTFDEIFEETEVQELKGYLYGDDGEGLIRRIRARSINVDTKGYMGITLLNWAIGANQQEAVKALLGLGADPNHFNDVKVGNLSLAIAIKNKEIIRSLAVHGSNMQREPNLHILQDAITSTGEEFIPLLIELGADPDYFDGAGNPLIHAISTNRFDIALLLLELGASPVSTTEETEYFLRDFQKWPFGHPDKPPSNSYKTDAYGELYQRMIEFGVAEPNEAHNEWLVSQGREPNS